MTSSSSVVTPGGRADLDWRPSPDVRVLAIDVSNLAYASAYVPQLAALQHRGEPTGVVHGVLQSVLGAMRRHPNALPVLLWDGQATWRQALYPPYKAHRADTPEKKVLRESVAVQLQVVREFAQVLGLAQVGYADAEADDVAGMLARAANRCGMPVRLASSDTDWWQALGPYVDWESPRDFRLMGERSLRKVTKQAPADGWASPQEYLEAKILAGDVSDEIEGVPGVGLITAAKLLRTAPRGLEGLLAGAFSAKGAIAQRVRHPDTHAIITRNRQLMDWSRSAQPDPLGQTLLWSDLDEAGTVALARDYGLLQLERTLTQWREHPRDARAWNFVVQAVDVQAVDEDDATEEDGGAEDDDGKPGSMASDMPGEQAPGVAASPV